MRNPNPPLRDSEPKVTPDLLARIRVSIGLRGKYLGLECKAVGGSAGIARRMTNLNVAFQRFDIEAVKAFIRVS